MSVQNETNQGLKTAVVATHDVVQEESLPASLGLNVQLFGFQLLNFAIVAGIVWFLILKPLTSTLEERKKIIDDSIDNAKEIETKLAMSEKKYQERIDNAKVESNLIIEKAHNESKVLADTMKQRTQEEVEKLVSQAKKHIQDEKIAMFDEVKKESAELIVSALQKILGETMTDDRDKKIIEKTIATIDKK